jgi:hypothetical protein
MQNDATIFQDPYWHYIFIFSRFTFTPFQLPTDLQKLGRYLQMMQKLLLNQEKSMNDFAPKSTGKKTNIEQR